MTKRFDGFKAAEMAAIYGLDEEATFKALDLLEERGVAKNHGDRGWFRV